MKTNNTLPPETPVIVKAYHKITGEEKVTEMTLHEWHNINKSKKYFYKCLQK